MDFGHHRRPVSELRIKRIWKGAGNRPFCVAYLDVWNQALEQRVSNNNTSANGESQGDKCESAILRDYGESERAYCCPRSGAAKWNYFQRRYCRHHYDAAQCSKAQETASQQPHHPWLDQSVNVLGDRPKPTDSLFEAAAVDPTALNELREPKPLPAKHKLAHNDDHNRRERGGKAGNAAKGCERYEADEKKQRSERAFPYGFHQFRDADIVCFLIGGENLIQQLLEVMWRVIGLHWSGIPVLGRPSTCRSPDRE
jgi:hypothetical protein